MVPDYKYLLDGNFSPDSRVWIYQSNRLFQINEALEIEDILNSFIKEWKSHGTPVKGAAHLLFGRFIVLLADEKATGVSGCSTDSSVRMIKGIEQKFNVNLFERQMLAFVVKDKVQLLPLQQLQYALDNNFITPDTLYFNNTVLTKEDLETQWVIPLKESWLKNRIKLNAEG